MDEDSLRHAWLARRVDRDIRAALQSVLLWMDSAMAALEDGPHRDARVYARKMETAHREVTEALALVDELVSVGRPDDTEDEGLWPRSIVVRDLLGAAVRTVAPEPAAGRVNVEFRVRPEDLRLVADPDLTLRAVVGLLRAGARSARRGEDLLLEATVVALGDGEAGEGGWVEVTLRAPRLAVGSDEDTEALCRGLPSLAVDPRRWPGALPLAAAGRCAEILEGTLAVEQEDRGARAVLRLPADRRPERRPGWIP